MRTRGLLAALLLALVSGGSPRPAHADERDRCASASEHAQDLRAGGKLRSARAALLSCAPATCPAVVRNDCIKWLSEVEAILPSVIIRATDPAGHDLIAVRVLVDGDLLANGLDGKAIPIDPGPHRIRYEMLGAAPVEDTILVRESEKDRILTVQLAGPPASASSPAAPLSTTRASGAASESRFAEPGAPPKSRSSASSLFAPLAFAGLGIAGIATFAILGIAGQSEYDRCNQLPATCTSSDISGLATQRDVAWIAGGLGVASLGAATWLFIARPRSGASVAMRLGVGRGAPVFQLAGRF